MNRHQRRARAAQERRQGAQGANAPISSLAGDTASLDAGNGALPTHTDLDPRRLLRLKQVRFYVPWSKSTIYQRVREGKFPAPLALGPHTSAWEASSIIDFLQKLGQARGEKT